MRFEITSFVAAFVVYLVRLRSEGESETTSLHPGSFLQSRSLRYMPDGSARSDDAPKNSIEPQSPITQRASSSSLGMQTANGFMRGCSRAVVVVAAGVFLHLIA